MLKGLLLVKNSHLPRRLTAQMLACGFQEQKQVVFLKKKFLTMEVLALNHTVSTIYLTKMIAAKTMLRPHASGRK